MYIGIDLGTSSVKIILVNHNQKILAIAQASLDVHSPQDGFNEQDPYDWILATEKCLKRIHKQRPTEFSATISIGISGHMHGPVLLDKVGKVIRPCILWNDTRSHEECIEFEDQAFDVRAISGNIAMPGFTAPKINWIKKNEPENFQKIDKILLPKDFLRFYLTGYFFSDMSDASGTLWMDIKERKWSDKLLSASYLTKENMPVLVEGNEEAGILKKSIKNKFKFNNNVKVVGGAGDNAASAIGLGVVEENQSFISLGTSGVFFTPTISFLNNIDEAVHSFCHCLPNKWHLMSVMLSASNCIDWVCSITGNTIEHVLKNAESFFQSPNYISNAPYFLPYLSGERTPHNDPNVRGSFHYLKTTTNQTALQYAVLEGISFGILDGVESIKSINGNFDDIFMVGGGSRSSFWLKLLSTILKRKLSVCQQSQFGAAIGVARLAMFVDENILDKQTIIQKIKVKEIYNPNSDKTDIFDKRYQIWRNIYSANKNLSSRY